MYQNTPDWANILFLDIETVPQEENYEQLSENMQTLYAQKTAYLRKEQEAASFYEKAGIWAEFGKVVCISIAYFKKHLKEERELKVVSYYGEEKSILHAFSIFINAHFSKKNQVLCAHNGKEFDFPYLARRMIIKGLTIPEKLCLFGKKPWEIAHLDTLDLWKFGDYKHYTSLHLLSSILGVTNVKEELSGKDVYATYYQEKDLDKIVRYCESDTIAVVQILLRYYQEPLLSSEEISAPYRRKLRPYFEK